MIKPLLTKFAPLLMFAACATEPAFATHGDSHRTVMANPLFVIDSPYNDWTVAAYQVGTDASNENEYICTMEYVNDDGFTFIIAANQYAPVVSDIDSALNAHMSFIIYIPSNATSVPLFAPAEVRFYAPNGSLLNTHLGQGELINVWSSIDYHTIASYDSYAEPLRIAVDNLQTLEIDNVTTIDFSYLSLLMLTSYVDCVRSLYVQQGWEQD